MTENKILLSILIPTVTGRYEPFGKLISTILNQLDTSSTMTTVLNKPPCTLIEYNHGKSDIVEIIFALDEKQMTIGEKREELYKYANGLFSWQIDDDDSIAPNAIQLILEAIKSNTDVDCITFEEHIDIDGKIQRSNHSLKYDDWHDNYDGYDYVRTPFMKSVIKTEIARSVPIPHIRFGEDHQWSQALKPHLKTETHIDEQIYRYIHRSSNPTERYGLDKEEKRNENSEPTNY